MSASLSKVPMTRQGKVVIPAESTDIHPGSDRSNLRLRAPRRRALP